MVIVIHINLKAKRIINLRIRRNLVGIKHMALLKLMLFEDD